MNNIVLFLEPKGTIMEVVREAKRRGFTVAALVTDDSLLRSLPAPYDSALACIDSIQTVDNWNDSERVLSLVKDIHGDHQSIVGVFSGTDSCAVAAAIVRERFNLPTPKPEVMDLIIDKHLLRTRLRELGLSRLRSFHGSMVDNWNSWELGGPGYFKPVHGSFSMYVERCENFAELQEAKRKWQERADPMPRFIANYLQSKPEYHVEEAFDGELMSIEAILFRGRFHLIGLTSRILYSRNPIVEMGSCFPYPHSLTPEIVQLVERVHAELGFTDGPTHTEVIVNSNNQIEIIDLNPRFIGADVLQSINLAYGINIEAALLDWALGIEPAIKPKHAAFSCIQYLLPPHELLFESIQFPPVPEVKFHTTFLRRGTLVSGIDRQIDYLGCYVTVMPSFESALKRSQELRERVLINTTIPAAY